MAERTLRERCIEAGGYSFPSDWLTDDYHIQIGEAALDAVLGVLTEYADEWRRLTGTFPLERMYWLAVLGGAVSDE